MANRFNVPKRQWRKWNRTEKKIFNLLYSDMKSGQDLFTHPKALRQRTAYWKTIAWNAAWMAAEYNRMLRLEGFGG